MARNNSELALILANDDEKCYSKDPEMSVKAAEAERGLLRISSLRLN